MRRSPSFQAMDLFNLVEGFEDSNTALAKIRCPVLILGSKTDILFPIWQQKQLADGLIGSGSMTSRNIQKAHLHYTFSRQCQYYLL